MTPKEYINQIEKLVSGGRDEDALDLATRIGMVMMPSLTPNGFFRVCGLLEGAELAIELSPERPPMQSTSPADDTLLTDLAEALARGDDREAERLLDQAVDARMHLDDVTTAVSRGINAHGARST